MGKDKNTSKISKETFSENEIKVINAKPQKAEKSGYTTDSKQTILAQSKALLRLV